MRSPTPLDVSFGILSLAAALLVLSSPALAQPVFNPSTGHWYRLGTPATWLTASTRAINSGGYLAVINDAAENTFVNDSFAQVVWLGGLRTGDQWQWANGDPWGVYIGPGFGSSQDGDALEMAPPSGQWNATPSTNALAYVVEHESPLFPTEPMSYGGHWYKFMSTPATWAEAVAAAVLAGGHLVVINDAQENEFVTDRFAAWSSGGAWIGGSLVSGQWQWVDGNPWGYANWGAGQPDNATGEAALAMSPQGGWDDRPAVTPVAYVIECDAQPVATRRSTWGGIKSLYR